MFQFRWQTTIFVQKWRQFRRLLRWFLRPKMHARRSGIFIYNFFLFFVYIFFFLLAWQLQDLCSESVCPNAHIKKEYIYVHHLIQFYKLTHTRWLPGLTRESCKSFSFCPSSRSAVPGSRSNVVIVVPIASNFFPSK